MQFAENNVDAILHAARRKTCPRSSIVTGGSPQTGITVDDRHSRRPYTTHAVPHILKGVGVQGHAGFLSSRVVCRALSFNNACKVRESLRRWLLYTRFIVWSYSSALSMGLKIRCKQKGLGIRQAPSRPPASPPEAPPSPSGGTSVGPLERCVCGKDLDAVTHKWLFTDQADGDQEHCMRRESFTVLNNAKLRPERLETQPQLLCPSIPPTQAVDQTPLSSQKNSSDSTGILSSERAEAKGGYTGSPIRLIT